VTTGVRLSISASDYRPRHLHCRYGRDCIGDHATSESPLAVDQFPMASPSFFAR